MQLFKTAQVSILSKCSIKNVFALNLHINILMKVIIGSYLYYTQDLDYNALNSHLYKIGVKDKLGCECGFNQESETHYLLFCPRFVAQREILFDSVSQLVDQIQVVPPPLLQTILESSIITIWLSRPWYPSQCSDI